MRSKGERFNGSMQVGDITILAVGIYASIMVHISKSKSE